MTNGTVDVVDDNGAHRKLMRLLLTGAGYEAREHACADAALSAVRRDPPVLLVADVQLSGEMDGLALARVVRTESATARIPILVVSALASHEDEMRARRAGCDAWLPKPFDTREFVALVHWLTRTERDDERIV